MTLTGTTNMDQTGLAIKGYSTFSKAPGLELHHQMQFSVKLRILVEGFYPSAEVQLVYLRPLAYKAINK